MRDVLALDANAFMRHAVRRYLCALQEERGGNVLLPAEALREAKRKYPAIAGSYARRAIEHRGTSLWGPNWSDTRNEAAVEESTRLAAKVTRAFREWSDAERGRNDAVWTVAEENAETEDTAMELAARGLFKERDGVGDPAVVAQALLHGAQIVATENFDRIDREGLDRWIEGKRAADPRFRDARTPFLVTQDQAWSHRESGDTQRARDWSATVRAYAVCRPARIEDRSSRERMGVLLRFESQIHAGRSEALAEAIARERARWKGREADLLDALEDQARLPHRTRACEARRIALERRDEPPSGLALRAESRNGIPPHEPGKDERQARGKRSPLARG